MDGLWLQLHSKTWWTFAPALCRSVRVSVLENHGAYSFTSSDYAWVVSGLAQILSEFSVLFCVSSSNYLIQCIKLTSKPWAIFFGLANGIPLAAWRGNSGSPILHILGIGFGTTKGIWSKFECCQVTWTLRGKSKQGNLTKMFWI